MRLRLSGEISENKILPIVFQMSDMDRGRRFDRKLRVLLVELGMRNVIFVVIAALIFCDCLSQYAFRAYRSPQQKSPLYSSGSQVRALCAMRIALQDRLSGSSFMLFALLSRPQRSGPT